jgi:hypothetical protein
VEKDLTGQRWNRGKSSPSKLYKSQIPVIEQALETEVLILGSDRSRGYCLERILLGDDLRTSWREPTWTRESRTVASFD